MTDFEFVVTFIALLGSLLLANVANNVADALRSRRDLPIGFIPSAINIYITGSVISAFVFVASANETGSVTMLTFIGFLLGYGPYIVVSRLLYPAQKERWASIEEYYLANSRLILGIMLISPSAAIFNFVYGRASIDLPTLELFVSMAILYGIPITTFLLLMLTRKRRWHRVGFAFLLFHRLATMAWIAMIASRLSDVST